MKRRSPGSWTVFGPNVGNCPWSKSKRITSSTAQRANGPLAIYLKVADSLSSITSCSTRKWEKGCPGCTGYVDELGSLSLLNERNTTFAVISRAPLSKLEAYKALRGWTIPWYSSFDSDFNYDFHVTLDENAAPREYNYRSAAELAQAYGEDSFREKQPGLSVFFHLDDGLFHTY